MSSSQQQQQQSQGPGVVNVLHRTTYRYNFPVTFQTHRMVLRPREGHDLQIQSHELTVSPNATLAWTKDVFGNSVTHAFFGDEQANELIIESKLRMTRPPIKALDPSYPHEDSTFPGIVYDPLEQAALTCYLIPTYPEEAQLLNPWLNKLPQALDFTDSYAFILELTQHINREITYRRREEKGTQTPATTVSLGSGSCRDMATLMMETLRHQGIASRFVSGYLDCDATRAAQGSTHAWLEAYLPFRGWLGFDPTAGRACDHRHFVIATSHHPRGVMPISGKFFGAGNAYVGQTVQVEFS
ncbi:transglutaminase family protein [Roseibacillus persicicus]|uniref:transglutaminase family protein n=1 Tax=Roseibacillus persicicus TaxID=454148 RepID=UPI00167BA5F7|nr:transglutaminase family protein [Roseibacillus persicicus]